jgi:dihydroneopterin aldolase
MSSYSTLFVKDIIISGIHGQTGRETTDPQRFKVDIEISLDISRCEKSDLLSDTYDYKHAVDIARFIVEHEHHVLIEKIASRIGERICRDPKISNATVSIQKLDTGREGVPGIRHTSYRSPQQDSSRLVPVDIPIVIEQLETVGGVSVPLLSESYRSELLEEARTYEYIPQPTIVGPAQVREELSLVSQLRVSSLFYRLTKDFEKLFTQSGHALFTEQLRFNDLTLQRYEKDSFGISPHMDGKSCINMICVFVLTGKAKFALCSDRQGNDPIYLDTTPGNVIIFRAPGFMGSDMRPFHFLSDVSEERIVFGLRQNTRKPYFDR